MATPPVHGIFLDNAVVPVGGRATAPVVDPADGSVVATVAKATRDDARAAMESSARAQPCWEALGAAARARILLRAAELLRGRAEELARLITREMGKVLFESRSEVAGAVDNLEYYAAFARTLSGEEVTGLPSGETIRLLWLPRGVVVAITPWNFPAATVTRKIAPALLGGNTMVLKPSSNTPLSSLLIAEVLRDAGLPPGAVNVVPGPGAEMGPALVQHPACSTVTLTGSTASGVEVLRLAAPGVVKCLLELGGKAPVLVWKDADLDWAARATVWARYWNAGQACIAAERCYVERSVADRFASKVAALVKSIRLGPGLRPATDMGPLYSLGARDTVARDVTKALDGGAQVLAGGGVPKEPSLARGAFYLPTVLSDVTEENPVAREEVFGPVLPLLTYADWDEAIARANASRYGLSSYVFTRDLSLAEKAIREVRFGETYVNRVGPESPQGYHAGFRQSGLAGEGTVWGVRDYLQLKTVYVDWREPHRADYFLPYPE
ncbi:MAG: aldehyde dehydrogenase family protein [Thermoplasmata archaeon]|jgi:acyl-CoA reductase-like NAD-dependent aldehyde dehydrogenase